MRCARYCKIIVLLVFFLSVPVLAFGLELESPAFNAGETIPVRYTGQGENISPELMWSDVPEGTKSFVLFLDDPDAPMGNWIHWVVFDIPGNVTKLEEDIPKKHVFADGMKQGMNSFRWVGYGGPCPPPGPAHRYIFSLYALDTVLDLKPGATKGEVVRTMQGHILASNRLTGMFGRK